MFKPIRKSDISIRPFKVYKSWEFDSGSISINVIRNLSGSFENFETTFVTGSNYSFNEYALNKSIRSLYYRNVPRLIGSVTNWDYYKHSAKKQYSYLVTSSNGLVEYKYYYDNSSKSYINDFQTFLDTNKYTVNSSGEIIAGSYMDVTKIYGMVKNFGSTEERYIGDRFFLLGVPQKYIGEGIKPGSVILTDYFTTSSFIDDGYGNMVNSVDTSSIVGNVFYGHGIVTITKNTELPSDVYYNLGTKNFSLQIKSTKTIYENEVFIQVSPSEFNISTNPTSITYYNGYSYVNSLIQVDASGSGNQSKTLDFRYRSSHLFTYPTVYGPAGTAVTRSIGFSDYEYSSSIDPTGSYLAPYITTIGLYDTEYNLVAVAKVPMKPKSIPDYPINFIVRFDT
jgi:hypothetical protein